MKVKIILISKELESVPKYHSNRLAEHWASIPKVVGSIPTLVRHIFSLPGVDLYSKQHQTQSKFLQIISQTFSKFDN